MTVLCITVVLFSIPVRIILIRILLFNIMQIRVSVSPYQTYALNLTVSQRAGQRPKGGGARRNTTFICVASLLLEMVVAVRVVVKKNSCRCAKHVVAASRS